MVNLDMNKLLEDVHSGRCKYKFENGIWTFYADNSDEALRISNCSIEFTTDSFRSGDKTGVAISPEGIFARYLIGNIILGEKLYIQSDDDLFYVGRMDEEFNQDNNGKNFGLKIQNSKIGNLAEIFLGLVSDKNGNKHPLFSLKGESGNVGISDKGIACPIQFNDRDEVDKNCSMLTYYRIPDNVSEIRTAILHIHFDTFKCYSKGSKAGGYYKSSINTSSSSGGYFSGTSEGGGGYVRTKTETSTNAGGWISQEQDKKQIIPLIDGFLLVSSLKHTHDVNVGISLSPHTHDIRIPPHTHNYLLNISIPDHVHEEILGCYNTKFLPSGVTVIVNGSVVARGLNNDCDVDITKFLKTNYLNEIELKSETLGKFIINIYGEQFMQY